MKSHFRNIFKSKQLEFIPTFEHLIFYNEYDIFPDKQLEEKQLKLSKTLRDQGDYKQFLKQKSRRPNYDIYACYQPFNESFKAVFPFLKELKKTFKKGDSILSLWDRSGWQTNLIAGLFPDQHIIATWEGNKDVLGYKGFNFWMKNHPNISVLFCDLNKPLPIKEDSIAFSCGYDTFHNFDQALLLDELFRVVKKEGAILFPHVHLTNSEPDPYFERGCKQMHGTAYQASFDHLSQNSSWQGFVFSEPDLFIANDIDRSTDIKMVSNPDSSDYNAMIALLPKNWKQKSISAFSLNDISDIDNAYILINLLLNIDLNQQVVKVDYDHLDGAVGRLLIRHPIYIERIKALDNHTLSDLDCKTIYLAQKGFSVIEIASHLNVSKNDLISRLEHLERLGLLQVTPVSNSGFRLQSFLMAQQFLFPKSEQNLRSLWQDAVRSFPDNLALISLEDESEFTYEDCNEIVEAIILALAKCGLKKGDKIIICSKQNTEAILLFWACIQIGIVVVPIGTHLPNETIEYIRNLTEAKLIFSNISAFIEKSNLLKNEFTVVFDEGDNDQNCQYFADWLESSAITDETIGEQIITHSDEAVILFTSGSTGIPKGVSLSHGNIFRSGRLISETFHWESEDRYFALGGLESMSGLRNSVIVPLFVGASIIIPKESTINNVFGITESIAAGKATFLGSNPSFLRQLVDFKERIDDQLDSLKTIICTGNKLSDSLRKRFRTEYNLPILNYYGLTETTGICISQRPFDTNIDQETIGIPIDCIAQIVDENGQILPIGQEGELRIFSENIMQGYYKNPLQTKRVIKDGWFYTNDLASFDEDGYIQLRGRKRNVIKIASDELIYLDEIQQFLNDQEFISEAVVCPYRKNDTEYMAAFIVTKEKEIDQEAIKIQLRKLILEKLGEKKLPKQIKFLSQLPYTDNGKLLTKQLMNEIQ
ncbi:MAG: class I adenylate-forming enzyme family protein [Saprospiraceae bacterium]|nr:class I adenylate-forming enzyme family protein [Saprospiraceae bacterium]